MRAVKNRVIAPLLACAFLLIFISANGLCNDAIYKVIKVYSGDTLKVEGNASQFIVKLAGIEAPVISEQGNFSSQPFSEESRAFLENLALNKNIKIKSYRNKGYNVFLAEVFVNKKSLNLEMLRAGLAQACPPEEAKIVDMDLFKRAEYDARIKKLGLWAHPDTQERPSKWIKRHKAKAGYSLILLGIIHSSE